VTEWKERWTSGEKLIQKYWFYCIKKAASGGWQL